MLSHFSHVQLFVTPWSTGFLVHGVLQLRTLEWVTMPSSRGSSQPRNWTQVSCISCIADRSFIMEPTWNYTISSSLIFFWGGRCSETCAQSEPSVQWGVKSVCLASYLNYLSPWAVSQASSFTGMTSLYIYHHCHSSHPSAGFEFIEGGFFL